MASDAEKNVDEKSNFLQVLQGYLWKTLNITISDGRMFEGEFMCTDRDMNIVLSRCCEHRLVQREGYDDIVEDRYLGLVMVPGTHVVSVKLRKPQTPHWIS
eukprot:Sdes_comp20810_c0_seq10m17196